MGLRPLTRGLMFVVASSLLAFATGCASTSSDGTEVSAGELNGSSLRELAVVKDSLTGTGSVTVAYEHADVRAEAYTAPVPFLGVEVHPEPAIAPASDETPTLSDRAVPLVRLSRPHEDAGATFNVKVVGDFPGEPEVLVTDEHFRVLGGTVGHITERGAEASLSIPASAGTKIVLVRDQLWVKPMHFEVEVSVGR